LLAYVDRRSLPYRTCTLIVHDVRVVQATYGAIREIAGIDRPEGLDL
jgi:hypothetical protein